ncbi:MAG: M15 family metallopeptidase [Patescibacteria group bacterium]|jgi:hypothetical protein
MPLINEDQTGRYEKLLGILVIVVLFTGITVCLAVFEWRRLTTVASSVVAAAEPTPLPLPTEMDANFLAQVERCLLPAAAVQGFELRVTSGYRTVAEQNLVFQQGRTENGHIVTEVAGGRSLHNYGLAVDVVDRWRGYDVDWERLGRIAAWCGLEQNDEGDQAHFTHRDGLSIEQLIVGFRPPPLELPCELLAERAATGQSLTKTDLWECGAPEF